MKELSIVSNYKIGLSVKKFLLFVIECAIVLAVVVVSKLIF